MPFQYPARVIGSNFEPIAIEVSQEGVLLPALGVTVLVNVKDADSRDLIVVDGVATAADELGRWKYYFTTDQITSITTSRTWLVEWTVIVGGYTWRSPDPATLPIRKRL